MNSMVESGGMKELEFVICNFFLPQKYYQVLFSGKLGKHDMYLSRPITPNPISIRDIIQEK